MVQSASRSFSRALSASSKRKIITGFPEVPIGITDEYEGIGHCALGYAAEPAKEAAPRKSDYVYYI